MNKSASISIGTSLRALREQKQLSQEAVARAAGIGRSTLVHLENGADVRITKAAAVARTLGATLSTAANADAANTASDVAERQLERARMNERNLRLMNAHLRLALDLIATKPDAAALLTPARERVALWARERTCSPFYIDTWHAVLHGEPAAVGHALARLDPCWELALMQNSPFTSLLRASLAPTAA
jgi:transcriptional regulator with XRE-family HTH domain